jgi:hypothetical protein
MPRDVLTAVVITCVALLAAVALVTCSFKAFAWDDEWYQDIDVEEYWEEEEEEDYEEEDAYETSTFIRGTTYNSDGTTETQIGRRSYGSDGVVCTQIRKTEYCN